VKSPDVVMEAVGRRMAQTWHLNLQGPGDGWPHRFSVGKPTTGELEGSFPVVQQWAMDWQDWTRAHGVTLDWVSRRSGYSMQSLPGHLPVDTVDTAARLCAGSWPDTLATGRARMQLLRGRFPSHPGLERIVRGAAAYSDVDFELLATAATWFAAHPDSGLSPRQVPIEGLHSKWLNAKGRTDLVRDLAGVEDMGLLFDARPVPIDFTYLDPEHRAAGGRLHDSVAPGTAMAPQYVPEVVIISENKDTAVLFPELPRAVAVQGHGTKGPTRIAQVDWMAGARCVIYWGDLDAAGFAIINQYRAAGVPVRSILMDPATLIRYARFQATTDAKGVPLVRSAPKRLGHLSETEQATYRMLTDPNGTHPIRVEQERITLHVARAEVHRVTAQVARVRTATGPASFPR
jgi:hypothetical protein